MSCSEGQLLTFTLDTFALEERARCRGKNGCIDWVRIYDNSGEPEEFCGSGNELRNRVHGDGEREIRYIFSSNSQIQDRGFRFFVQCSAKGVNAAESGILQSHDESCTSTPQMFFPVS